MSVIQLQLVKVAPFDPFYWQKWNHEKIREALFTFCLFIWDPPFILTIFFLFFQESTIGAAFLTQTVLLDDTTVKFEIWDTAGQERYHSLAPMYYRGAQAAIVVYDITNADTFTRAKTWVRELQKQARPDIVIALAGNKSDLGSRRTVEYEEANAYAEENGLLFMETSAKNANNVNEIFLAIARRLPRDAEAGSSGNSGRRLEEGGNNEGGNKLGQCCNRWCI